MKRQLLIALLGPTASGKTALALELAKKLGGEILCLDSTTVYREFNIGTSKPTPLDRKEVPHHLVDILNPEEPFSAHHFVEHADEVISQIHERGKLPIIVGGTYFYLRALQHGMYQLPVILPETIESIEAEFFEDDALNTPKMHARLQELDSESAKNIHPNDRYRLVRALAILKTTGEKPSQLKPVLPTPEHKSRLWVKYALAVSRHDLTANIVTRTDTMLSQGLVEETRRIWEKAPQAKALGSIGYSEALSFLHKKITEKQLRNEIIEKTRQLAKRQVTWLRSDPEIRYIDKRDVERVALEIENLKFAIRN